MGRLYRSTGTAKVSRSVYVGSGGVTDADERWQLHGDVGLPTGAAVRFGDNDEGFMTHRGPGSGIEVGVPDNNALAFLVKEGTNNLLAADTTDGAERVRSFKALDMSSQKITSLAAGVATTDAVNKGQLP